MSGYLSTQLETEETRRVSVNQVERLRAVYGTLISSLDDGLVLEIGPGRGELLEVISGSLDEPERRLFCIDIDDEVVEHVSKSYPEVSAQKGDPLDFLADGQTQFSAVFMLHVLEHLDADYAVRLLTEIRRNLARGGVLVIEVPNSACSYVGNTIYSSDITHSTPYTSVSLKQVCRMAGFESIEVKGIRPSGSGLARFLQRAMIGVLIALDRLVHKVFLPSWSFLHEATIYAVCLQREGQTKES